MPDEIVRRIEVLEKKVETLEEKINDANVVDIQIKSEIKSLSNEFQNLKVEVLDTLKNYTDRIWKLIDSMIKILIFLIIGVLLITGIKLGPELIKLFL